MALFSFLLQALPLKRIGPERASENKENEVENKKKPVLGQCHKLGL